MSRTDEFRSPDLYFSAYLQVAGLTMVRTETKDGRVFFVFDTSVGDIDTLKEAWFNHGGKVPALPYANAIKSLKSLCHMK